MLLGALTKEMHSANVLLPRPEVPFPGQRFEDICVRLLAMRSTEWFSDRFGEQHGCNLLMTVHNMINAVVDGVKGLNLSEESNGGRKKSWAAEYWRPVNLVQFSSPVSICRGI